MLLPGVGVRYEFQTSSGEEICLVAYRDGRIDLLTFDQQDPDQVKDTLKLSREEAETIAELMGAPRIAERLADLSKEIPGLMAVQVELPSTSPYTGRTLGDTRCRTRTGASIVALVREDGIISAPGPQVELEAGDTLVVIGTEDGIIQTRRLLGAI